MSTMILDQSVAEKLQKCTGLTVLRDATGKVIGYFEPPEMRIYNEGEVPELDWVALRQRLGASEKLTTEEVLKRLREQVVNHRVVWNAYAFHRLSHIWDRAVSHETIARAIDQIQTELAVRASEKGESRPEGLRVYFAPPLAVVFWANDRITEVEIVDVWAYGPV